MSGHDQRDEVFFAVVERTTAIEPLMDKLYAAPTAATQEHFLHVNKHVTPWRIPAGLLVVVTPAIRHSAPRSNMNSPRRPREATSRRTFSIRPLRF